METDDLNRRNRRLLYATAFIRAVATGMIGILLGVYLIKLLQNPLQSGVVVSLGLVGAALAALFVTAFAGRLSRTGMLIVVSALSAFGGAVAAFSSEFMMLCAAAVLGMMNGMGRDRGASLVIEQSLLPETTSDEHRTKTYAWYNVIQDIGHALGSLFAAVPELLQSTLIVDELSALRFSLGIYALVTLVPMFIYPFITLGQSKRATTAKHYVSPQSRRVLWKISALFAVDGIGGGFMTTAFLSMFFVERFGVSVATVSALFVGARIVNAASHLGAAWLAKRIGLVNTMVFTHIPSSLLLVTVPFAPSFWVAAFLFILREGLVEMDVPTRQSYVMAVVEPDERTFASGVTHLVRLGAWAIAPGFAGVVSHFFTIGAPLVVGSAIKISYDLMLYKAFRTLKPPEEIKPI